MHATASQLPPVNTGVKERNISNRCPHTVTVRQPTLKPGGRAPVVVHALVIRLQFPRTPLVEVLQPIR